MHSDDRLPEAQLVHPGEKVDDLQRSGLRIIQDPARFCFGMDAVLLTGFIQEGIGGRSMAGEDLLDLGTGTGIIPLLMSAKSDCRTLTGLEIQKDSAQMAMRSVELNGIGDRVRILQGDIKEADAMFAPASFAIVTCNPPYMIGGHGLQNPDSPKAIARHEVLCDFTLKERRPLLSGAPALPAGRDHDDAAGIRPGAQAHAPGLPLRGPGAQHGPFGLRARRKTAP